MAGQNGYGRTLFGNKRERTEIKVKSEECARVVIDGGNARTRTPSPIKGTSSPIITKRQVDDGFGV